MQNLRFYILEHDDSLREVEFQDWTMTLYKEIMCSNINGNIIELAFNGVYAEAMYITLINGSSENNSYATYDDALKAYRDMCWENIDLLDL